jgi:hypothetical protein
MDFLFIAYGWPHLREVLSGVKINDFPKALLLLKHACRGTVFKTMI